MANQSTQPFEPLQLGKTLEVLIRQAYDNRLSVDQLQDEDAPADSGVSSVREFLIEIIRPGTGVLSKFKFGLDRSVDVNMSIKALFQLDCYVYGMKRFTVGEIAFQVLCLDMADRITHDVFQPGGPTSVKATQKKIKKESGLSPVDIERLIGTYKWRMTVARLLREVFIKHVGSRKIKSFFFRTCPTDGMYKLPEKLEALSKWGADQTSFGQVVSVVVRKTPGWKVVTEQVGVPGTGIFGVIGSQWRSMLWTSADCYAKSGIKEKAPGEWQVVGMAHGCVLKMAAAGNGGSLAFTDGPKVGERGFELVEDSFESGEDFGLPGGVGAKQWTVGPCKELSEGTFGSAQEYEAQVKVLRVRDGLSGESNSGLNGVLRTVPAIQVAGAKARDFAFAAGTLSTDDQACVEAFFEQHADALELLGKGSVAFVSFYERNPMSKKGLGADLLISALKAVRQGDSAPAVVVVDTRPLQFAGWDDTQDPSEVQMIKLDALVALREYVIGAVMAEAQLHPCMKGVQVRAVCSRERTIRVAKQYLETLGRDEMAGRSETWVRVSASRG